MNQAFNNPEFQRSLRASFHAADEFFRKNRVQIERLTSGAFDTSMLDARWREDLYRSPEFAETAESVRRQMASEFASYPNLLNVVSGRFAPSIDIAEVTGAAEVARKASQSIAASIGDISDLTRSFNAVIASNFGVDEVEKLVDVSAAELEDEDVKRQADAILGSVPNFDDGTTDDYKLKTIVDYCSKNPTAAVGGSIIMGILLMHFFYATPETAKLVEASAIITTVYNYVKNMMSGGK